MTKKLLFILIFINSCALFEYRDIPTLARSIVFGAPDIEVTPAFYDNLPYSFAKVKIGRSRIGFMVLLSINNGVYEWIGSNDERVFTKSGKIISTIGLDYNMNIINAHEVDFNCLDCLVNFYTKVDNPEALLNQETKTTFIDKEEINLLSKISTTFFVEKFKTKKLKWQGENRYWFNEEGLIVKSVQTIHPNLGEIEMTFYYK